ncbi:MAG: hypothetical protein EBT89_11355, partial [Opitutaceae bacterium]|nr:hypothetical protein [Opitutaceae bacterium]
ATGRRLLLECVAPGSDSLVLVFPISSPSRILALRPNALDLLAHRIGAKHLLVLRVEVLAALGDVDLLAYRRGRLVSPAAQAAFAAIGRHG